MRFHKDCKPKFKQPTTKWHFSLEMWSISNAPPSPTCRLGRGGEGKD